MEPVVHLRDAVALLGRFPALAGIDLDVERGDIVLLRGPNGAGKTTVLRALAGLVPVVRGEARVLGHDLRVDPRPVRRRVGLLAHATGLFDDLTVGDNVTFWGRATRATAGDIDAALSLVGLSGRLRGVPVARLSAGQRRRTSLACLLARRPELWLLDEPHAGLDSDARDLLDGLVRQAVAQGATVVMSSHELERAEALADRVVVLDGGTTDGPERDAPPGPGAAPGVADPGVAGPGVADPGLVPGVAGSPVADRGAVPGTPADAPETEAPDTAVGTPPPEVSHVA
jgi:ABC-2 type transport system ATP-binding protein